jgi:competence protein ComEC
LPLTLLFFNQFSIASIVANLLAIPYLSFVVLPLSMFAIVLLCFHSSAGIGLALLSIKYLVTLLAFVAHYIPWQSYLSLTPFSTLCIIVGFLILCAPRGFPARYVGLLAVIPLLCSRQLVPMGEVELTMLDVGQGLSMIVQKKHHVLVYDTGERFLSGSDMGQIAVVPYLHHQGISHVDTVVISHGDNDHSGGARSVIAATNPTTLLTSVPKRFKHAQVCQAGQSWQWDGVTFSMLYPDKKHLHLGNNSSCVLQITTKNNHNILLTGDIEKISESFLVNKYGSRLQSHFLQVPHHGSKTSSSPRFIHQVDPQVVLYSYGFSNRYHFPHKQVLARYEDVLSYNTVDEGAIILDID